MLTDADVSRADAKLAGGHPPAHIDLGACPPCLLQPGEAGPGTTEGCRCHSGSVPLGCIPMCPAPPGFPAAPFCPDFGLARLTPAAERRKMDRL